jgi:hypothetical protein
MRSAPKDIGAAASVVDKAYSPGSAAVKTSKSPFQPVNGDLGTKPPTLPGTTGRVMSGRGASSRPGGAVQRAQTVGECTHLPHGGEIGNLKPRRRCSCRD